MFEIVFLILYIGLCFLAFKSPYFDYFRNIFISKEQK